MIARLKSAGLSLVRRGPREILWTPREVYLGNHLYYWLNAFHRRREGVDIAVLVTDEMARWRTEFPRVFSDLTSLRRDVSVRDRRVAPGARQTFGVDFDVTSLREFIECYLLDGSSELGNAIDRATNESDVTINVRRGDYYSVPRWRGYYSFDVVEFVRTAIGKIALGGPIDRIHLVSDDVEWCRIKLGWLRELAPVTYPEPGAGPLDHLAALARSPRLVLANSSFSYWGGYLSTHRAARGMHGGNHGVWAPAFNNRGLANGGRATQLHPEWNIIEDIPGGWDG